MNFRPSACMFALLLLPITTQAQNIYHEQMLRIDKLGGFQAQTLKAYSGNPMLMSFFMPNCRWCQRQHRELIKLQAQCPTIQPIMLGVQGSKLKLKQELKREKNTFPAYIANKNIIKAIGAKSPVPMMILFDKFGEVVLKTVGFTPIEKLTKLFSDNQLMVCQAKLS